MTGQADTIGRFAVLSVLGEGGMGTVYAAFDDQLDRRIAVKVVKGTASEATRRRMLREAQAMAKLAHPNVVPVFEVGEDGGEIFVAMEYVKGHTLRQWREQQEHEWPAVVAMYLQAGAGLAAAHDAGLVHRDFKPDNAVVGTDGRVRVLDFGLAARHGEALRTDDESTMTPGPKTPALDTPLTETGARVGTPAYMAPEQLAGSVADHRSDQFSFCVALWEALYGKRPFSAGIPAALFTKIAHREYDEPDPGDVPVALRRVLAQGLECAPEDRWPDMHALLAALDPFVPRERDAAPGRPTDAFWAGLVSIALWVAVERGIAWMRSPDLATLALKGGAITLLLAVTALPAAVLVAFATRQRAAVDPDGNERLWWRRTLGSWPAAMLLGLVALGSIVVALGSVDAVFGGAVTTADRVSQTRAEALRRFLVFDPRVLLVAPAGAAAIALVLHVAQRRLVRGLPLGKLAVQATTYAIGLLVPFAAVAVALGVHRPSVTILVGVAGVVAASTAVTLARPTA